jgi:hypothetical protein
MKVVEAELFHPRACFCRARPVRFGPSFGKSRSPVSLLLRLE